MNHIYRRIWSAAKRCWVVGSELSRRTKGRTRSVARSSSGALALFCLSTASVAATEYGAALEPEELQQRWADSELFHNAWQMMLPMGNPARSNVASSGGMAPQGIVYQLAMVSDTVYSDLRMTGNRTIGLGSRTIVEGNQSAAYGNGIRLYGNNSVAMGDAVTVDTSHGTAVGALSRASGGYGATAFGNDAHANGGNNIAVGSGSRAGSGGGGMGAIAVGADAFAGTSGYSGAIAMGNQARASYNALALGYQASATSSGAVAIGAGSVGNESNAVSVGSSSIKRRVVNVQDARLTGSSADAVTGSQLYWAKQDISRAQTSADTAKANASSAQSTANTAKSTADNAMSAANAAGYLTASGSTVTSSQRAQASGTGALASGLNALASGSGASAHGYNAKANAIGSIAIGSGAKIEASSSNYGIAIGASASTGPTAYQIAIGYQASAAGGASSMALGASTKANHSRSVALGVLSVTTANDQVSIGSDSVKRTISGMKDGLLSATSTEGVTGKQLFETNAQVGEVERTAKAAQTAADTAMDDAGTALTATTVLGGLVGQVSATGNVRLGEKNSGTALDVRNSANANRKISGVSDADLGETSTDAVSGRQLHATNESISKVQSSVEGAERRVEVVEETTRFLSIGSSSDRDAAKSGVLGIALGESSEASILSEGAVAIGAFSRAQGEASIAIGRGSWVHSSASGGFALGTRSIVEEANGVAIGAGSSVTKGALNSVALGDSSVANESRTVSFGDGVLQRRLVSLANGTADHNATTVSQLKDSLATLGAGADMDASGNVNAPTYAVQGGTQSTVEDALMALDGAVITAVHRADKVDGQLSSIFQDSPSARADGIDQIALNGANGMVLTNLADGRVAPGSRDAVTGNQLYAAEQKISQNRNDLETMRKEREVGAQTMRELDASVIDYGGARLTGVAGARLSADSSDVVRGSQLYETNSRVSAMEGISQYVSVGTAPEHGSAQAGPVGLAIGNLAKTGIEGGTAIGTFAEAMGKNSIAIGRASTVYQGSESSFAVGTGAEVGRAGEPVQSEP